MIKNGGMEEDGGDLVYRMESFERIGRASLHFFIQFVPNWIPWYTFSGNGYQRCDPQLNRYI